MAAPVDACSIDFVPAPLRALADRLEPYPHLQQGWSRYLPAGVLKTLALSATPRLCSADGWDADADTSDAAQAQELCFAPRQMGRSTTQSTTASVTDVVVESPLAVHSGSVAGKVWLLSQDPLGCRRVQDALEAAPSNEEREALAQELRGHVPKAIRCKHANHVVAKCIATLEPRSFQFIVEELAARESLVLQFAKHRYGCRIIQQLLKYVPAWQLKYMTEVLMRDLPMLVCHVFGNYVVQVLLECGTEDQHKRVVLYIKKNLASIGRTLSGGGVIGAALTHAGQEDKVWISRALLQDPEILPAIANTRNGSTAVQLVLETLDTHEIEGARASLLQCKSKLKASRFGAAFVEAFALDSTAAEEADGLGFAPRRCGA